MGNLNDKNLRLRKRDGVWAGFCPDDGWFYNSTSRKCVCWTCRKVWRRFRWNQDLEKCPHCGGAVQVVNAMSRIPRKGNVKAWKRAKALHERWAESRGRNL